VVTILPEEFQAVRLQLPGDEIGTSSMYAPAPAGDPDDPIYPYVVVQARDRSNTPMAQDIRRWVSALRPEIFIVSGIAGGIQRPHEQSVGGNTSFGGLGAGDLAIASYVHYGAYAKYVPGQRLQRYFPIDHPAADLVEHCTAVSREPDEWIARIGVKRPKPGDPTVEVGELVALEGVASDPGHQAQREIVHAFDNAIAIDMESMGVGRALHDLRDTVHYNPRWACIRGISDAVQALAPGAEEAPGAAEAAAHNNNAERKQWKPYAAAVSAAYTRRVVARILSEPRRAQAADPDFARWELP
jgi:nucleoside phosphorylase